MARRHRRLGVGVDALLSKLRRPQRRLQKRPQKHFARLVYDTIIPRSVTLNRMIGIIIPRNVTLAEAPSHGMPALRYDKSARGSRAYVMLAGEALRRNAQRQRRGGDG